MGKWSQDAVLFLWQQFMTALVGACDAIMLGKLSQAGQPYHCSSGMHLRIYPETAGYG